MLRYVSLSLSLWLKSNVKSLVILAVSLENISMDLNNMMAASGQGFQQQVNQAKPSLKMTISVNPKKQKQKKERKKKKKKHRKRVDSDEEDEDSASDSEEDSGEDPDYS